MFSNNTTLKVTSKFTSKDCFGFEFKLDKFSTVTSETSSKLVTTHNCKTAWRVIVETTRLNANNINRRAVQQECKMRVGLRRTPGFSQCDVTTLFSFEVLNSSGIVYFKESFEKVFSQLLDEFFCDYVKKPGKIARVISTGEVAFALPDDKLIIRGNVIVKDCFCKSYPENVPDVVELQSDFKELYKDKLYSDVVFIFGETRIQAHKAVLSIRSPVFKKMFEQDMIEKKLNTIKITDIEKQVFDYFLIFLYTGVIENKDLDVILSLYATADKYLVAGLFGTCSNILESYISDKSASCILMTADLHNDEFLKERAVHFICENFTSVEKTVDWYELLNTNPSLGSHVLIKVSLKIATKCVKKT